MSSMPDDRTTRAVIRDEALRRFAESRPDAVTLRFGIKMTVEAGAIIARTAVEGNMEVEMSWQRDEATGAPTPKSSE